VTRARVPIALLALSLVVTGSALANAIDPARSTVGDAARLNAGGTAIRLAGVMHCPSCRSFTLGATVSQSSSGAVGQGGVRCVCHGDAERWFLTARAREATRFEPGAARVCVWVIARRASAEPVDARQWCESVALRRAG
jgi:Family of unknown function (DUF6299)